MCLTEIRIHFNPGYSNIPYIEIRGKENLIQYYEAISNKHINLFTDHKIPWQHYNWILAWRPVAEMFDQRYREVTSQSPALLIGMIPEQPPAEPLNGNGISKLHNYRKRIGDR